MINTKAQGISINTIIIAAIALLVLVIVAVIFMIRMGVFSSESNKCENYRGECMPRCDDGMAKHPSALCYNRDGEIDRSNVCCVQDIS